MLERNKTIAREFLLALGNGDAAALKPLMCSDITVVTPGTSVLSATRDYADVIGVADIVKQAFPLGIRFEILFFTAENDRVSVEAQGHATTVTGDAYNNRYHFLFFVRDGAVYKIMEYLDTKLADKVFAPMFTA